MIERLKKVRSYEARYIERGLHISKTLENEHVIENSDFPELLSKLNP